LNDTFLKVLFCVQHRLDKTKYSKRAKATIAKMI